MDENLNFLNTVVAEIVAQLECVEDLLADDGRFDEQVYMVEQTRIAIENQLHKLTTNRRNDDG